MPAAGGIGSPSATAPLAVADPVVVRLLDTPPARGAWNMALDEALMDSVRAGAPPVLRIYRWDPPCLSLGRNQPAAGLYDRDEILRRGLDVVRRPTGGRAVIHGRELTYSVIVAERSLGTLRESYGRINRALVRAVRSLGVPALLQPRSAGRSAPPSIAPCFQEPAEGEVVVQGRKLIGSAQWRHRGVLLQHGSLLFADDQALLQGLTPAPDAHRHDPPATLSDLLQPVPGWEALAGALAAAFGAEMGSVERVETAESWELSRAYVLRERYESLAWTWRR